MDSIVSLIFSVVLPGKENIEVFNEALEIEKLREEVVARLINLEKEDLGRFWWEDKALMNLFETVYKSGCILLPKDPVERLRWIALLCIEMSKKEDFSYGNIIIPPDYLPDEMVEIYEQVYGSDVIEEVIDIRSRLLKNGWKATLGV